MRIRRILRHPILQPCALTGHDFQIDPYVGCEHRCRYCYALSYAESDWAVEIHAHREFSRRLSRELDGIHPQSIYFGWHSDPYQPAEADLKHTREALRQLASRGFSACILTKSDLVIGDLDILAGMPRADVGFSLAFTDEEVRALFEEAAPCNERRLRAMARLKSAGIRTYALINPVMPFITDVEALIRRVAPYVEAIWVYGLRFENKDEPGWKNVVGILERNFANSVPLYRDIVFSENHPYWAELKSRLLKLQAREGYDLRIYR